MRYIKSIALLLALCCALFAGEQKQEKQERFAVPRRPPLTSRLVLISIAGLGAEQWRKNADRLPKLHDLAKRGATSAITEGVYPSLIHSSRATLLTGMLPVDHGVFDEEQKSKSETILDLTSNAKLSAIRIEEESDEAIANKAIEALSRSESNLIHIEFTSFEAALARRGFEARETLSTLEAIDQQIGRIVDAGGDETTFIIVSDGGRLRVEREFRPNVILARKGLLETGKDGKILNWRARAEARGGAAAIILVDPQDEKLAAEVEEAFKEVVERSESPIWSVVARREISRLGADPRASFYLDAAPFYVMSDRATGGSTAGSDVRIASGYLPSRSEMRAIFIAAGRGIRSGSRIEYARLVDIAPTIARLLGLEMKVSRGRVIDEVLAP